MASKGDSAGFIHPKSRKAKQILRGLHKADKKQARHAVRMNKLEDKADMCRFVQQEIKEFPERKNFSIAEICTILSHWVSRYDEELEDLQAAGRNRVNRELQLKILIQEEKQKLKTGYEAPDLRQNKVVRALREWDGEANGVHRFVMYKFKDVY